MINSFPSTINTFATNSQRTVGSLIRMVKADKVQVVELLKNASSFNGAADFAPVVFRPLSRITAESFVDFYRDIEIRLGRYYSASNVVSVLVNSMADSMMARISKLEKDISYLENYVNNYEFISGKDDLYNYSYIENFDNDNGSSEKDSIKIPYVDRDGNNPLDSYFSGGYVDVANSRFKIGSSIKKINMSYAIKNVSVKTNYDNYISSSSDPKKMFDDKKTKSWSVSIKSPRILTGNPVDIEKYVGYDFSYIVGAKTIVEFELKNLVEMDTIKINPSNSYRTFYLRNYS
jgi:hypothetical protein